MDYEIIFTVFELGINYIRLQQRLKDRRKKFRRWWSKPLIRNNSLTGYNSYERIFRYFKLNDEEEFINLTRMNVQAFTYLYNLVGDSLMKYSWRIPLPAELRLCITLDYLAHGDSAVKNAAFYGIGCSTYFSIIPEVCEVLCQRMLPIFLRFPTAEEFAVISEQFKMDLYFPNCIGALDGRHCPIQRPCNSGSRFWNYKKFYSIVLMACCDAKKRFIWINIGDCGSFNDAGIFAASDLGEGLANSEINLPPPAFLPGSDIKIPHFLIGDGGFPIKNYLMKPYLRSDNMTVPQKVFNYRLSHARSVIEGAFGLLSKVWLINQVPLHWKLSSCRNIIMSTVCLHNFLLDFNNNVVNRLYGVNENNNCMTSNNEDINNELVNDEVLNGLNALTLRTRISNYFVSPAGSVPFQWEKFKYFS